MTTNRREIIISSLPMQGSPKETKERNKQENEFENMVVQEHPFLSDTERHPTQQQQSRDIPSLSGARRPQKRVSEKEDNKLEHFGNSFYSKEMQRILCMSQPGNNGRVYEVHRNKGLIIPQRKLPSKKQMPVPLLDNIHYCTLSGRTQQQAYKYLDFKVSIEKNV